MIGLISNCGCIDTFLNSSSQTNTKSVMHNVKEEEAKPLIIGYSLSSPIIINPSQKFPYSDLARKYSVSKIKYLEVKKASAFDKDGILDIIEILYEDNLEVHQELIAKTFTKQ